MGTLLVVLFILAGPLGWGLIFIPLMGRLRETRRLHTDPTRRTEKINDKEYIVYTEQRPLVREKRTGRIGIAIETGQQSSQWIKVQFIRKKDGQPGRYEWRDVTKFERVGTADLDFLTYQAPGKFRRERLNRFRVNTGDLARKS